MGRGCFAPFERAVTVYLYFSNRCSDIKQSLGCRVQDQLEALQLGAAIVTAELVQCFIREPKVIQFTRWDDLLGEVFTRRDVDDFSGSCDELLIIRAEINSRRRSVSHGLRR